jgi:transposase-like protein
MKTAKLPVLFKLSKDQVAEAMELLDQGVAFEAVANEFDVHRSTLSKYIRCAELYGYSFWRRNPRED